MLEDQVEDLLAKVDVLDVIQKENAQFKAQMDSMTMVCSSIDWWVWTGLVGVDWAGGCGLGWWVWTGLVGGDWCVGYPICACIIWHILLISLCFRI